MRIEEIPSGARVAIDANIFIYHFGGKSASCRDLLRRCERGDLQGFLSVSTLAEFVHRMMLFEALERGLIPAGNPARRLGERPEAVRQLSGYERAEDAVLSMGLTLLEIGLQTFSLAREVRRQFGLMVNDSLMIAVMKQNALTMLASADQDFERVPDIALWRPSDLSADIQ